MKPSVALELHRQEIRQIVECYHACNARIFGSVLHGDDNENSELDLLIDITSETSLLDIAKIQNHLQQLLHVSVDVLTPNSLPQRYRAKVLHEAIPV